MTGTRRNILSLSPSEVQRLTSAFNVLKANGTYDEFIRHHVDAMNIATPPGSTRNAAHRAPAFLPWHRATLLEPENALQAVDPSIEGLPYWRWQNETALNGGDPRRSPLWSAGGIGGDGDPARGNRVLNGPFAHWVALIVNNTTGAMVPRSTPGLIRMLGRDPRGSTRLPDPSQVTDAIDRYSTYDRSPWDATVATFRNRMEGWSGGPRMHNLVHRWVGGDMLAGTSPNDPVFWLVHGNVDRLWWVWQGMRGVNNYQPASGGPTGHNLNDTMQGLIVPRTPADVLDITRLDYTYV
ncbi:tyrosinase family protein [Modestobacter marinus]|uniref:tyrosinase family protein n=1 Tax=Modestobacter marinus TaxID=477641 RepID=UPI00201B15DF|nr:tyrosinase family protein [Modestobacter marinus]